MNEYTTSQKHTSWCAGTTNFSGISSVTSGSVTSWIRKEQIYAWFIRSSLAEMILDIQYLYEHACTYDINTYTGKYINLWNKQRDVLRSTVPA